MALPQSNSYINYNYEDSGGSSPYEDPLQSDYLVNQLFNSGVNQNSTIPSVAATQPTTAYIPRGLQPVIQAEDTTTKAVPYAETAAAPALENTAVAPTATTQPTLPTTGVFGVPLTPPAQTAQPVQAVQPVAATTDIIDALAKQILGQGYSNRWSGEGFGSAEKNAQDMAKILASIGVTDINQFGKVPELVPAEVQKGVDGQVAVQDEEGRYYIPKPSDSVDADGNRQVVAEYIDPSQLKPVYGYRDADGNFKPVEETKVKVKDGVPLVQVGETFGNKATGQAVPNTYSERQTGNFFGGTFAGKGNTGYGVQFDSKGNPIFYTQGASSNDLANLLKDLGPIGQIAIAAATGGMSLPAQLATNAGIQLLAGGNLGDIAKGTALSYLGGQAGNLISGSKDITDVLGQTGTNAASKFASQFVGSGGNVDPLKSLVGSVVGSNVNNVIGDIPGLENLSATDKNLTSNLIAAVATGTPIDQAIQNALVNKASSEARNAVAEARNAPTSGPQTYEEMMAGIEPRMADKPSEDKGPSNQDILDMINYDPSLINQAVEDTLGTKTENAAEPAAGKGKAMDDIDWSQVGGDYGGSISDEMANLVNSGNSSSLFSGDGGEDVAKMLADQPYQFNPDDYKDAFASGNIGENNQGYYDEITGKFVQDPLGGLLNPLGNDVGNLDPNSKWEYSQTRPGVWVNDKGEEIDLSYLPNPQKTMTGAEIMKKAGVSPAGSTSKTSTSKTTTAPGSNNTGLLMALMAMMAMMNNKGSSSSSGATIPSLQANRSQLPYSPTKPGSPNVNYFTPTTYTAKAAEGGLMGLAAGGMSDLGGYSDGGRLLRGPGDGVSDSIPATIGGKQPARLATGEFVVPARIVSELGNGSTDAGAKRLYDMMDRVQKTRRKTKNVAADTKAHKYLPS